MKNAVITGVSSGIGYAIAKKFIEEGYRVFGSVRKQKDADRLREDFGDNFEPLFFDLTDDGAIKAEAQRVEKMVGKEGVQLLVNNGGISGGEAIMHVPISYMKDIYDVNTLGMLRVSQAFFALLKVSAKQQARPNATKIINLSSGAGRVVRPFLGAYAATKHAVEAISDAMRREIMRYSIDVIVIEPGPVATEIWGKAKSEEVRYKGTDYEKVGRKLNQIVGSMEHGALPASVVGDLAYKAFTAKKPRTRYLIAPKKWMFWLAINVIPDRMMDKIFNKAQEKIENS